MPVTFDALSTITLTSDTNTISFGSIPQTYTDLVVLISGQAYYPSGTYINLLLRINGDTGSNYSYQSMYSTNLGTSTNTGSQNTNTTGIYQSFGAESTNNGYDSAIRIDINDYTNTNVWKSGITQANGYRQIRETTGWCYRSTSAITSISFKNEDSATGVYSGTVFALFGIKKA